MHGGIAPGSSESAVSEMSGRDDQSQDLSEDDIVSVESLFGIIGEQGNNIMIYSSESVVLRH